MGDAVAPSFSGAAPSTAGRTRELRCPALVDNHGTKERCGRLLAEQITAPFRIQCPRCKHTITAH